MGPARGELGEESQGLSTSFSTGSVGNFAVSVSGRWGLEQPGKAQVETGLFRQDLTPSDPFSVIASAAKQCPERAPFGGLPWARRALARTASVAIAMAIRSVEAPRFATPCLSPACKFPRMAGACWSPARKR